MTPSAGTSTETSTGTSTHVSKPLIVVLGLGDMGSVHARNLSKLRYIRLGLASTRADKLATLAAELHADAIYSTYEAVLADAAVNGVVIATPFQAHAEMILAAARAGKHIFCEKPLGSDSPSIRATIAVLHETRVRFMCGFMRRWDPGYSSTHATLTSGQLGSVVMLKCTSGDPEYPEKYHRGGAKHAILLDLAVHDIDLARWMTGSEVVRVFVLVGAKTYPNLVELGDGDVCAALLEMRCGATALVHLSRALTYGYNVTTEVVAQHGTLRAGDMHHVAVESLRDGVCGRPITGDYKDRFVAAFEAEMEAFAKLVLADDAEAARLFAEDSRYATVGDGLNATLVSEAMIRSQLSGKPEPVHLD